MCSTWNWHVYRYMANLRLLSITIKTRYTYLQSVYVHLLSLFIYKKDVDFNHEYKYTWTASVKKKHLENIIFANALLLFVCDYFFWFQIVNLASAITSLWAFYCGRIAWSGPQPRSWGGDGKSIKATFE